MTDIKSITNQIIKFAVFGTAFYLVFLCMEWAVDTVYKIFGPEFLFCASIAIFGVCLYILFDEERRH